MDIELASLLPSSSHHIVYNKAYNNRSNITYMLFHMNNSEGLNALNFAKKSKIYEIYVYLIDYYSYKYLPRCAVSVLSCFTVTCLFASIHLYGWFIGLIIYGCVALCASYGLQRHIQSGISRINNGIAWGIIISICTTYWYYVRSYCSVTTDIVIICCMLMTIYNFYYSITTLPQYLEQIQMEKCDHLYKTLVASSVHQDLLQDTKLMYPRSVSNSVALRSIGDANNNVSSSVPNIHSVRNIRPELEDTNSNVLSWNDVEYYNATDYFDSKFKLCTTCLINKHKQACCTHCSYCNHCVVDIDHHCYFVDNCVGKGNRRAFVYFTFFAAVGCGIIGCNMYSMLTQLYPLGVPSDHITWLHSVLHVYYLLMYNLRHHVLLFSIMCTCFAMTIWIGFISWGQITMVILETTTYEVLIILLIYVLK